MSLLGTPCAFNFLCSSASSHRLHFHRSANETIIDFRIMGSTSMSPNGRKGFVSFPFSSQSLDASTSVDPHYLSTSVESPSQSLSYSQWYLGPRHIHLLNIIACTVAVSVSWLFFSAIPALLAFKKAAESLEKLLDVTADELPDTMAALRLSGMEISDLTMELSDIGREIKQRVRGSTRAVLAAEERLRNLTTTNPIVSTQMNHTSKQMEITPLAKKARNLQESIVKGRTLFGVIFGVSQFSRWARNFASHNQRR